MTIEITIKIKDDRNDRRIFYIDVGDMPSSKAAEYLERIKKEINGKRIKRD